MHPHRICWRVVAGLLAALLLDAVPVAGQARVPVRELNRADAHSGVTFGAILGVRQLANGKVLVNDGGRRELVMLDADLSKGRVLLDSAAAGGRSYGASATPIIPYLGDSTLFVDGGSLTLLVLDPAGSVARVMAAPKPTDLRALAGSASGVDPRGNLVYRGLLPSFTVPASSGAPAYMQWADSAPVVRANFDTRTVDTLGRVRVQVTARFNFARDADGKVIRRATVAPVLTPDEWTVLSDGTIAIVRGRDYHVEWLHPDGSRTASPALPFDWRRISDAEKQHLVDSARTVVEAMMAASPTAAPSTAAPPPVPVNVSPPVLQMLPLPDYYPPIRDGAVKADREGNLWILPTTSAQTTGGELVYDVVRPQGGLVYRVRVPAGRSIAGFGAGGAVYLMSGDAAHGWVLERARVRGDGPSR